MLSTSLSSILIGSLYLTSLCSLLNSPQLIYFKNKCISLSCAACQHVWKLLLSLFGVIMLHIWLYCKFPILIWQAAHIIFGFNSQEACPFWRWTPKTEAATTLELALLKMKMNRIIHQQKRNDRRKKIKAEGTIIWQQSNKKWCWYYHWTCVAASDCYWTRWIYDDDTVCPIEEDLDGAIIR